MEHGPRGLRRRPSTRLYAGVCLLGVLAFTWFAFVMVSMPRSLASAPLVSTRRSAISSSSSLPPSAAASHAAAAAAAAATATATDTADTAPTARDAAGAATGDVEEDGPWGALRGSVAIAVKTGAETHGQRIIAQAAAWLYRVPHLAFVSDADVLFDSIRSPPPPLLPLAGPWLPWLRTVPHFNAVAAWRRRLRDLGAQTGGAAGSTKVDKTTKADNVQAEKTTKAETKTNWKADAAKNIASMVWMLDRFPHASWYILADDDTFMFLDNLASLLGSFPGVRRRASRRRKRGLMRTAVPGSSGSGSGSGGGSGGSGGSGGGGSGGNDNDDDDDDDDDELGGEEGEPGVGNKRGAASNAIYLGTLRVVSGCADLTPASRPQVLFNYGGAGIIVSRAALQSMVPHVDRCAAKFGNCWAGDVMLGLCLREAGVLPVRDDRLQGGIVGDAPHSKMYPLGPQKRPSVGVGNAHTSSVTSLSSTPGSPSAPSAAETKLQLAATGWQEIKDLKTHRSFYYNSKLGQSQWEMPPLGAGAGTAGAEEEMGDIAPALPRYDPVSAVPFADFVATHLGNRAKTDAGYITSLEREGLGLPVSYHHLSAGEMAELGHIGRTAPRMDQWDPEFRSLRRAAVKRRPQGPPWGARGVGGAAAATIPATAAVAPAAGVAAAEGAEAATGGALPPPPRGPSFAALYGMLLAQNR